MTSLQMRDILQKRLQRAEWHIRFNREKDTLRVEHIETKKGITVSLPGVIAKWQQKKEDAVDEVVYYVEEALQAMHMQGTSWKEDKVFPVIRSTSFPLQNEQGVEFVVEDHTAETRIYYVLDMGKTYRLLDKSFLHEVGITEIQVKEIAAFNVRSLPVKEKRDEVAGNVYYFLRANDGYDASRILDESLLEGYRAKVEGDMVVAVPHQDVLIVADIRNDIGYDIIAQMTMQFFSNGLVPITSLSFLYEDKELEPIFVLGKNRPNKKG
jgi:uncharacterized protein YtpQ (UPF0354 family)